MNFDRGKQFLNLPFHASDFVGVIDSGVGGLTVLKQLQIDCPFCNFLYLADSAYCPYGTKTPTEIYNRVDALVSVLSSCGAKAIVIACNTASVYANDLRRKYALPIYDVITPTARYAAKVTRVRKVALLATAATVKSQAYTQLLNSFNVEVVDFNCSAFVPFVECNQVDSYECQQAVQTALKQLPASGVDTVIFGCTHFPILRKKIAPYCNGATIVTCKTDFQPPKTACNSPKGQTVYFTTGDVNQANSASQWFKNAAFCHVDI